jgi:flagellar hook-length control protein FliK
VASQLANLLVSAVGAVAKPTPPAPIKAAERANDQFARLVDTPAKRPDAPASQSAASNKPAANDTSAKSTATANGTDATAAATETTAGGEDDDSTGTKSLADTLLAALQALGLSTDALASGETEITDPAALKDIKDALEDLSQLLGMDMTTLMQQLTQLAKGVAAEGAGETELAAKLGSWLGERLGAADVTLDTKLEASLAKLFDGLGQLAKAVPTEPALSTAQLKLTEPVLAGSSSVAAEKPEVSEPELKVEPTSIERKAEIKPADTPDANQNKAQANQALAARAPGAQDNVLNLTPTQAPQADPTAQVDATAAPRVVQTGYQTSQQQLNLPQIAFEMSRQAQDGNTRFQIRLDPPELGRIDVKLDIDNKGHVHARLTVEKAETLDLMQRDQRALEKALQQAGLDQSKTNLEFSLKQNPFAGDQNQRGGSEQSGLGGGQDGPDETEVPAPAVTLYRGALQASGVNIIA